MSHNYRLNFDAPSERGYRLHKLEVHNWGAFDGQVFCVRPEGKSTLLIGQNGSGKSTLVDALLTLLVRPGVRNFNVAAGAKKKERDEKSYLRGAYDRGSDDSGQGIEVKYLRPEGKHYTVILAWFKNDDLDKSFTLAQLLYLASDQSVEKIYCLAEGERSIAADFSDLGASDTFLKRLRSQGWRATRTFTEFEAWFLRQTHARPKAMEVFNQTVAVKDIQKLNEFIREHMLEAKDWNAKVEELLAHFTELSEAHASLVRARDQQKLLVPVAEQGAAYRQQAEELRRAEGMLAAIDLYFAQQTIALFTPVLETWRGELARTQRTKKTWANNKRQPASRFGNCATKSNTPAEPACRQFRGSLKPSASTPNGNAKSPSGLRKHSPRSTSKTRSTRKRSSPKFRSGSPGCKRNSRRPWRNTKPNRNWQSWPEASYAKNSPSRKPSSKVCCSVARTFRSGVWRSERRCARSSACKKSSCRSRRN